MKNAVGREIPEEILTATGKEPFQGSFSKHLVAYHLRHHFVTEPSNPMVTACPKGISTVPG